MYNLAVSFDVPPKRQREFIDAALENSSKSRDEERGTRSIDLIRDKTNKNRFYLYEAYDEEAAFNVHCCGPHFKRFFSIIDDFAIQGPRLIEGTLIENSAAVTTHE
jgi:(4S)-4-hydroxy-5-phosphonooxypentane-2,3-dione isomerase